jgi:hypothetical protein
VKKNRNMNWSSIIKNMMILIIMIQLAKRHVFPRFCDKVIILATMLQLYASLSSEVLNSFDDLAHEFPSTVDTDIARKEQHIC